MIFLKMQKKRNLKFCVYYSWYKIQCNFYIVLTTLTILWGLGNIAGFNIIIFVNLSINHVFPIRSHVTEFTDTLPRSELQKKKSKNS